MKTGELHILFKALSNEQRLKLFLMLVKWCAHAGSDPNGREKCFTKACQEMNLSRATISHHFKELQKAGLIQCTRNGQSYVCHINYEAVHAIRRFVEECQLGFSDLDEEEPRCGLLNN